MCAETTKVNSRRAKAIEALMKGDDGKKATDVKKKKTTSAAPEEDEPIESADLSLKVNKKADTLQYEKKSLHDQILLRPDTYIGSVKRTLTSEPVYYFDETTKRFNKGFLQLSDGLIRLFIEVISNAIDNVWRSKEFGIPVKFIKIQITPTTISVWNDGRNIPTGLHPTEKVYTPEMIFGHLLTSSNYNDSEERKTSGKNGLGVKLSSAFSTSFKINIYNKEEGVLYTQEWSNNMKICNPPKLAKRGFPKTIMEGSNGFTEVTFSPDFARFGLTEFDRDHLVLLKKLVYDAAMTVSFHGVKVFVNEGEEKEKEVPVKDIKDYVGYYFPNGLPEEHVVVATPDCKVCLVGGAEDWTHVSFVNGIFTKDGGVHVDTWAKALFDPIVEKCTKKKMTVTIRDIRKHFFLFVYSSVDKPTFESQSKNRLTGPKVETDVKAAVINKISKWDFMEKLELSQKMKEDKAMKDNTERKRGRVVIRGLDEATKAGTKDSKDCVLCVAKGTPINIGQISVPIEQLEEFIEYDCYTYDEVQKGCNLNKINKFWNQGKKECVQVTFIDGKQIICTPDHKILTVDGWVEAQDALSKNAICSIDNNKLDVKLDTDWKLTLGTRTFSLDTVDNYMKTLSFVRILGFAMTDGNLRVGYDDCIRGCVYLGNKLDVQEVCRDISLLTGKKPNVMECNNSFSVELPSEITDCIKHLENEIIIGKRLNQRSTLPKFICSQSCPLSVVAEFLGAMFGGDGHAPCFDTSYRESLTGVNFSLCKEEQNIDNLREFLQCIASLLKRFDIETSIRNPVKRQLKSNSIQIYEQVLSIPNKYFVKFHECIGFKYCYPKQLRLNIVSSFYTLKQKLIDQKWRRIDEILNSVQIKGKSILEAVNDNNTNFPNSDEIKFAQTSDIKPTIIYKTNKNRNCDLVIGLKFSEFLESIGATSVWKTSDKTLDKTTEVIPTFYKKVIDVRSVGERDVYDIEVSKNHNFLAQGVVLHNCVSEGESAKGYIIAGIKYGVFGKKGNEYIGVMPIRGKFLNVKNAKKSTLIENEEVKALIQALGLQFNVDYRVEENRKKLRYGRFIAVSDSDNDGFHITGLLYNFFHTLFPTLLEVDGFFNFMRTPILKINKKSQRLSFFYLLQAKEYIEANKVNKEYIKYYKGLGTSTKDDIKDDFGRRVVTLLKDPKTDTMVEQVFSNEHADFRKTWIQEYTPRETYPIVKDYETERLPASDFFNFEMIQFSIADNNRSIPNVLDGLKESQRKILYVAFKRNLKYDGKSLKVAQFGASVAETTNYHYGENSLFKAIVKMGQRFVGANNVPLLYDDGNFGSRNGHPKNGIGEDAASPRYIFTRLAELTRFLFRAEDDDYLPNIEEEGEMIEKAYYLPILPVALLNGCEGIGSGWRCELPMYNPVDVASWVKQYVTRGSSDVTLTPWFRGFKGEVSVEGRTVTTRGLLTQISDSVYRVHEIPVGVSIERFKDKIKDLQEDGTIKDIVTNNNTENTVDMTFKTTKEVDLKKLGLISTYSLSTMVFFNSEGKLFRYDKVEDILKEFCDKRAEFYVVRKQGEIKRMQYQLDLLENKARFIREVLSGTIVLRNKDEDELSLECSKKGYSKIEDSYDYLLSIQIKNMTAKKVEQLESNITSLKDELKAYTNKTTSSMWIEEIDAFISAFLSSSYMKEDKPVEQPKKTKK